MRPSQRRAAKGWTLRWNATLGFDPGVACVRRGRCRRTLAGIDAVEVGLGRYRIDSTGADVPLLDTSGR